MAASIIFPLHLYFAICSTAKAFKLPEQHSYFENRVLNLRLHTFSQKLILIMSASCANLRNIPKDQSVLNILLAPETFRMGLFLLEENKKARKFYTFHF